MQGDDLEPAMPLRQARGLVRDLLAPDARVYWADFLASILLGHLGLACFVPLWRLFDESPTGIAGLWAVRAAIFVAICIFYYRAANFIHELAHLRGDSFVAFRVVWNLLCGVPFLMPSFLYATHLDHHRRKHYGTEHDGEYFPFGSTPPWNILAFLLTPFVAPLAAVVRFLLLAPLSWCIPPLREWVLARASSMIIDPSFERSVGEEERRAIFWQELACFGFLAGTVASLVLAPEIVGFRLLVAYAAGVAIFFVNTLRTLGAHAWTNDGREMTFAEQVLDSYNYPSGWAAELWGPIGLRYHALHHLFPSLPYHHLPEAHRRLMAELPADSPYRRTVRESLTGVLWELWQRSLASGQNRLTPSQRRGAAELASFEPAPTNHPSPMAPG